MKPLLLAAAAAVLVAGSAAAQSDNDHNRDHRGESARPQRPDRSAGERTNRPTTTGQVHSYGGQAPGIQRFTPRNDNAGRGPGNGPQNTWRQQHPGADHHMVEGQDRFRNNSGGNWRNNNGGNWRNNNGGNWRQGQRSEGWWRGQRGFEGYGGRRDGYWYAPGRGYYQPDPRWLGFDWEVGVAVPFELRSYYVNDPYDYGLPPAPYGCAWIYLDNQIVLIDLRTGRILQMGYGY
jgi:Ni/Co efflux regulator RcnB